MILWLSLYFNPSNINYYDCRKRMPHGIRFLQFAVVPIFLDEIQKCPEAVTYIKYLVRDDGRYHYILSGSLLGVELKNIRSVPVGVLDEEKMYPLDFEEFVLANGESEELIGNVAKLGMGYALINTP